MQRPAARSSPVTHPLDSLDHERRPGTEGTSTPEISHVFVEDLSFSMVKPIPSFGIIGVL